MKTESKFAFLSILVFLPLALFAAEHPRWVDARDLTLEGKGWSDVRSFYDRLPARAETMVRPPVWNLSKDSAGMCVRFVSDAPTIQARWVLRKDSIALPHMPASGVSGLDLYFKEQGKWHWLGAGRPKQSGTNEAVLVNGISPEKREFLLYFPLYNGVHSLEIGIPANATLAPASPRLSQKPIAFYGTSILQGGCASRPGMAYPAIIGRKLDWPMINLGFSGNAKSEPELAQLLKELDPSIYVLDPLPNMDAAGVLERIEPLVRALRQAHARTPIVLVESVEYTDGPWVNSRGERYATSNAALREVRERLRKGGIKNLHYVTAKDLIGSDGEGTVDGTHATDLGFMRMAEKMTPVLRKLLPR